VWGVFFADVGMVVITSAWCRGTAALALCRRGDVASRCRQQDANVADVGKGAVTTNGDQWAPHLICLALGRKLPPPLCQLCGRRVKKG